MSFSELRIFLCMMPTSMSFSFDRLMGQAQQIFDQDPLSGHLFLFLNRDRNRLKILFWDRDGFCIWYKKFETENTQIFVFTEADRIAHNRGAGVVEAGGMVRISRNSGPRRRPMSGQTSPTIPPRATRQRVSFGSINSGRS